MKAILFPGQGSQTVGMGLEFYNNFEIVKKIFSEADNRLGGMAASFNFDGKWYISDVFSCDGDAEGQFDYPDTPHFNPENTHIKFYKDILFGENQLNTDSNNYSQNMCKDLELSKLPFTENALLFKWKL